MSDATDIIKEYDLDGDDRLNYFEFAKLLTEKSTVLGTKRDFI